MRGTLRKLAAQLPASWQQELKRRYFRRQIRTNAFRTKEPEYDLLPALVSPGDCVIDIGANVGHYTLRLSELVGENGRVIAFEPVPETFELLARHAAGARWKNITLVNAAASASAGFSGMTVPTFANSRLGNYYRARLSAERQDSAFRVLCLPVDSLPLPARVRLVKIDAEGHEFPILHGMKMLLERDHPTLIVEDGNPHVVTALTKLGYRPEQLAGSCNRVFRFGISAADPVRPGN